MSTNSDIIETIFTEDDLLNRIGSYTPILAYQNFKNYEYSVVLNSVSTLNVLSFLKKHINFQFNLLTCISGADLLKKKFRFLVAYDLSSITFNSRLRVKVLINEYSYLVSATQIFRNANWWEREIWDLYGIYFDFHPDLRRILTDYGFEGYPMRKDFPLFGFRELKYDNNQKHILSETIFISQEFRNFSYDNNW